LNLDEARCELEWLVICILAIGVLILAAYIVGVGRILEWIWRLIVGAWGALSRRRRRP